MTHHRRGLRRLLEDDELATAIERDFESAALDTRRLAMLRYAVALTATPPQGSAAHVDALRQAGFADEDILSIVEVAAYYAYANRIVNGLGVEIEGQ